MNGSLAVTTHATSLSQAAALAGWARARSAWSTVRPITAIATMQASPAPTALTCKSPIAGGGGFPYVSRSGRRDGSHYCCGRGTGAHGGTAASRQKEPSWRTDSTVRSLLRWTNRDSCRVPASAIGSRRGSSALVRAARRRRSGEWRALSQRRHLGRALSRWATTRRTRRGQCKESSGMYRRAGRRRG
jgi:hypothetical protein